MSAWWRLSLPTTSEENIKQHERSPVRFAFAKNIPKSSAGCERNGELRTFLGIVVAWRCRISALDWLNIRYQLRITFQLGWDMEAQWKFIAATNTFNQWALPWPMLTWNQQADVLIRTPNLLLFILTNWSQSFLHPIVFPCQNCRFIFVKMFNCRIASAWAMCCLMKL